MVRRTIGACLRMPAAFAGIWAFVFYLFLFLQVYKEPPTLKTRLYKVNTLNTVECRQRVRTPQTFFKQHYSNRYGPWVCRLIFLLSPGQPLIKVQHIVNHHLAHLLDSLDRHITAGLSPPIPGRACHPQHMHRVFQSA